MAVRERIKAGTLTRKGEIKIPTAMVTEVQFLALKDGSRKREARAHFHGLIGIAVSLLVGAIGVYQSSSISSDTTVKDAKVFDIVFLAGLVVLGVVACAFAIFQRLKSESSAGGTYEHCIKDIQAQLDHQKDDDPAA